MSLSLDPSLLLVPIATAALTGCILLQQFLQRIRRRDVIDPSAAPGTSRPCLYCLWGKAQLRGETTTYDHGDMVETRCYACSNCGLPQWVVTRTSVRQKAG